MAPTVNQATPASDTTRHGLLRVACVGDIAFAGKLEANPAPETFSGVAGLLAPAAIVVGNLECALTDRGTALRNKQCLRGSPSWAPVLRNAGFSVLSLANNHLMDYGVVGLRDTLQALGSAGIAHCGAGENLDVARAPAYVGVGGQTVAFLARTDVVVKSRSYAEMTSPGVAKFELSETAAWAQRCRERADYVVLLLHWGLEEYTLPAPEQRRIAAALASAGVDAVVGTHSHVVQGREVLHNTVVHYSIGNFVFDDYEWDFTNSDGVTTTVSARLLPEKRKGLLVYLAFGDSSPSSAEEFTRIANGGAAVTDKTAGRALAFRLRTWVLGVPLYPLVWSMYSILTETRIRILRALGGRFTLRKLWMIRPRHIREAFSLAIRSLNIITRRSSDPYG